MEKIVKKAYKFRFYPQHDLAILLANTFGCVRFVYNHLLHMSEENFKSKFLDSNPKNKDNSNINPNYKSLSNNDRINYVKTLKDNPDYSFLREVSSIALQQSAIHLNKAYERFFNGVSAKPSFKKKINRNSFTITGEKSIRFDKDFINNKQFYLPKYKKPLKIKFSRSFNHHAVTSFTVSVEPSGKYYISFLVEEKIIVKDVKNNNENIYRKVSYDVGVKTHVKFYDGKEFIDFNLPELLKEIDKKIIKAQKILSRKKKGSKNRNKQRIKLARLHEKRNNILTDSYQKLSTLLINENQEIAREDLSVSNMLKNRKLSKAIHNVSWSKFNEMMSYKSGWHNRTIVEVNRYYPSSKMCNCCKHVNHELKLRDRVWECSNCHTIHDRDENACINLYNYDKELYSSKVVKVKSKKIRSTAGGALVEACGGNVKPNSVKKGVVSDEARILLV